MRHAIRLLAILVLLGLPEAASAGTCEGGRYIVDPVRASSQFDFPTAVIVVTGNTVSMEPCGDADRSKVRRRNSRMIAKAVWSSCTDLARRVKLHLKTARGCERAKGKLRTKRPRAGMRFGAERGCEFVVDCLPGALPVDTDGDGCRDSCEPQSLDCSADVDCWDEYLYCGKDDGDCGGEGVCRPRAEFCTYEYDPVCGCDGITYGNACDAASSGMNLAHSGPCEPCLHVDCPPGSMAVDTDGDGCTDSCQMHLSANSCTAASAGVNIAEEGACPGG